MIQSFAPGEVTPEQAMQIGEELCDRYLKGDYQYVIAVHHDKSHLHCHIIFNNTNLYNGLSFTTEHNQGRKSERAWAELREISDEICAEHGISVISEPEKGHGVSHFERNMQKEGKSWKDKLRVRIAVCGYINIWVIVALVVFEEIIAFVFCPVENKNKPIEKEKKPKFKAMGMIVFLLLDLFGGAIINRYQTVGSMILLTNLLIAVLIISAKIKEKRCDKNEII